MRLYPSSPANLTLPEMNGRCQGGSTSPITAPSGETLILIDCNCEGAVQEEPCEDGAVLNT